MMAPRSSFVLSALPYFLRVGALAAAATLGATGTASADTTLSGSATVRASVSDNVLGAPSDDDPLTPDAQADVFISIQPGLTLTHNVPRARLQLNYAHPIILFVNNPLANQSNDVAGLQGFFELSPNDQLTLGLNANRTTTSVAGLQPVNQAPLGTLPTGQNTLFGSGAVQSWSHDFDQSWRLAQSADFSLVAPIATPRPQPLRYVTGANLSVSHIFGVNAISVMGDVHFNKANEFTVEDLTVLGRAQVLANANLRYMRDLNPFFSTEFVFGLVAAVDPETSNSYVGPGGGATLRWNYDIYQAALSYSRNLQPNLISNQTLLVDQIALTGGFPISEENNLVLNGNTGFSVNQILGEEQEIVNDPGNTWIVGGNLSWRPVPYLNLALQFQHFEQFGQPETQQGVPNFVQNVGSFEIGITWPPVGDLNIPAGPPTRVDGAGRTNPDTGDSAPVLAQ